MKAATIDGRPIIWQNMDWGDHKVVLRKHVNVGSGHDALEIVKHGASIGWNALNAEGLGYVVNKLAEFGGNNDLGKVFANVQRVSATIADFKKYLDTRGAQKVGENFLVMDKNGRVVDFEVGPTFYYPYDPESSTRQQQSFFQSPKLFVSRGNNPFKNTSHKEPDSVVDTWGYASSRFRYRTARNQFIQRITNADKLTIEEVMGIARWGNPGYDTYTISRPDKGKTGYSIWSTIMLGVKAGEDPRYATMLVSLGLPDYSIFIPAWVVLSQAELSGKAKTWDGKNIAWWSYKLFEDRFDSTADYDNYINSVFADLQKNIVDAVKAARKNWLVSKNTTRFKSEAYLLHDWAARAAFETIKAAYDTAGSSGRSCNLPPKITSLISSKSGLSVTFDCDATDADGVVEYILDFGDGNSSGSTTKATQTHTYKQAGTYLVGCYVRDGQTSPAANVKFTYITVVEKASDGGIGDAVGDQGGLDGETPDTGGLTDAGGLLDNNLADGGSLAEGGSLADAISMTDQEPLRQTSRSLSGGCGIGHHAPAPAAPPLPGILLLALALLIVWRRS